MMKTRSWRFGRGAMIIPKAAAVGVALALIAAGCETRESMTRKRIRMTERGLLRAVYLKGLKPERLAVRTRMQFYRVPAASLAVMDGNALEWARAYGVREAGLEGPVNPETMFQAGALGQPVIAAATLEVAGRGGLDLDSDVNAGLTGWKVPRNRFTAEAPVTVRRILSHTAGFSDAPMPGFPREGKIPSLAELLGGRGMPGGLPVEPVGVPGQEVRPSEQGYAVLRALLSDAGPRPFPELVRTAVLEPLGMTHSVFEVPLPADRAAQASSGHGREGFPMEGKWLEYPAGGFWTTPSDLVAFASGIMQTAMGRGGRALTSGQARSMLTPQAGNRGFGFTIEGSGTDVRISLRGRTSGYTCALELYPYKGQGAVIMTNSDNGFLLTDEILRALSDVYEWPDFKPQERTLFRLDPSMYDQYVGRYEVTPEYALDVTFEDYYLVIRPTGQAPTRFYVENQTFFFSVDPYIRIQFTRDARGVVDGLVLWQQDFKQEARKTG